MLIDTHTHLSDATFDSDRSEVIERARQAGVGAIVVVSETLDEAHGVLELCAEHSDMLHPAIGLFPTHLDPDQAEAICELARSNADRLVAIGEVGLDYWKVKDESGREVQRAILARFVDLANELDLPLNVHSRSAGHYTIDWLAECGARKVHLHAYDGKASSALPAVERGWCFSIPPSVVRSPQKQKLVRRVPLENLLLETDSPVLGPTREVRNEPANVVASLRAIAEIKDLPQRAIADAVTANTRRLYDRL